MKPAEFSAAVTNNRLFPWYEVVALFGAEYSTFVRNVSQVMWSIPRRRATSGRIWTERLDVSYPA